MIQPQIPVAREGYPFIAFAALASLAREKTIPMATVKKARKENIQEAYQAIRGLRKRVQDIEREIGLSSEELGGIGNEIVMGKQQVDTGVERQQIGLKGNLINSLNNLCGFIRRCFYKINSLGHFLHTGISLFR